VMEISSDTSVVFTVTLLVTWDLWIIADMSEWFDLVFSSWTARNKVS
jgi:hypothetical protein